MVSELDIRHVPMRRLSPKGGGLGGPTSTREGNECQQGRWLLKGVDYEIPRWLGGK